MPISKSSPIQQLEHILKRYQEIKRTSSYSNLRSSPEEEQMEIITSMVTAIERLAPQESYFLKAMKENLEVFDEDYEAIPYLLGIIKALKTAYDSGYFYEIEELIHAELFSDFLDMGEYLLNDGYKDPAAVIIGGVLEEHLRKLCLKNSISITVSARPKKADQMNSELAKASVYNVLDQKNVTAWLDLRNKAAHGRYTEYIDEQVNIMLLGVRDFISRLPA